MKTKLELGMPTLIELDFLEENAALCKELGLAFLELNMNLPDYQVEELEKTERLNEIAECYGIYYTIHLDENLNVCDFNKAVANAYLDTVRRAVQAAKKIKVPILNMHMNHGVHFTLPNRKVELFEQYEKEYLEGMERFCSLCKKEIGEEKLRICIENTNGFRTFEKKAVERLLSSHVFGLTWDVGHSYVSEEKDVPFLMKHENDFAHFHIHDADSKQCHLALGTGTLPLRERILLAKKHGCRLVIETKTVDALKESIEWIHKMEIL